MYNIDTIKMLNIKDKNIKWWLGTISYIALFAVIIIFTFMKMSFIMKGVQIVAEINKNGNSSLVLVSGNAKNATYISLNGREIFIDKDGTFKELISLLPGFSVIELAARDKFGKMQEKKFEVVYEGGVPSIAINKINSNTTQITNVANNMN
jgi:hypothetical protein